MKRPAISSRSNFLESSSSICESLFAHHRCVTLQAGIELYNAIQHKLGQIYRGQIAQPDSPADFCETGVVKVLPGLVHRRERGRARCFEPAQRNNRAGSEQSDGVPPSELAPVQVTVHQRTPQKMWSRQESQAVARRLLKQPSLPENSLYPRWIGG